MADARLWLSLLKTSVPGPGDRPPGVYGVALVDYQPGSPLTYGELLVARPVTVEEGPQAGKHVTVTDLWVDSAPSRQGVARCGGPQGDRRLRLGRRAVLRSSGRAAAGAFKGTTWQLRDDGSSVVAALTGSSRAFPVRGRWSFDPDGPLSWLVDARPWRRS